LRSTPSWPWRITVWMRGSAHFGTFAETAVQFKCRYSKPWRHREVLFPKRARDALGRPAAQQALKIGRRSGLRAEYRRLSGVLFSIVNACLKEQS